VGTGSTTIQLEGLEPVKEALDRTRWGASIYDPSWNLVWVSEELADLLGTRDEAELGLGQHVFAVFRRPRWRQSITSASRLKMLAENLDYILHDTPGGKETIAPHLDGEQELDLLERAGPRRPPPIWAYGIDYVPQDAGMPIHVHTVTFRLRDEEGKPVANVVVYHTGLPASLTAQLVRGDRGLFERMARLAKPGRREVAIMFADLERSGMLSRHTPSAVYFSLIRRLTDEMDRAIVQRQGIVGKHAGDGVSAFFLTDDLGSAGTAIAAAIESGRQISAASSAAEEELRAEVPEAEPTLVNIGVHWGSAVYIGQLATEGRLEVTALGDEVNECARIQESASGGSLLVSKTALEQLSAGEARSIELDPEHVHYTTLAELPGASEKARRDAGTIAVAQL
jgi:class 3 adenylate cyclase